jgi:hypothetical protein
MPQSPVFPAPSDGDSDDGEVLGVAALLSQSSSSSAVSSTTSGRRRSKRGGSSLSRRRLRRVLDNTQKHYAPHACCFEPYRPPAAAVLDPFPSLRINAICMAGLVTLVTVHRSGVRLYRERQLSPKMINTAIGVASAAAVPATLTSSSPTQSIGAPRSPSATRTASTTAVLRGVSTASGVFEQVEVRNDFQVQESYLCTAMQPVLVDDAVLLSKWSRYFCVASGNDRVVHSVSVMSSGAHFCLHHEAHQSNKVVCMHCTQIATEPFHPAVLKPAVVSVDEVGTLVLFDVEREVPCVLEKAPLWFKQSDGRRVDASTSDAPESSENGAADAADRALDTPRPPPPTSLLEQHLSPEEEVHVVDAMEKVPVRERATYHLDHGVATRVTLVGPCLELCNHCHNAFTTLTASRGYTLVSVYVCTRAHDLPIDGNNNNTGATASSPAPAAELNVVLLRVLWGPRRAFVLEEVKLVQEAAPTDVCEAGVATAARPYQVGLPMTLLLARPALTLWQLRACTGEQIDTRSLYCTDAVAAGENRGRSGYGGPPRAASEFIIHWVPLGRHRLTIQSDDRIGSQSWFCIAAVTDDGTVLLLGRAPRRCTMSPTAVPAAPNSPARASASPTTTTSLTAKEEEPGSFTDADLEGWLDDLHTSPASSPPPPPPTEAETEGREEVNDPAMVTMSLSHGTSPALPYTVLMKLYSPAGASGTREGGGAPPSVAAGVLSIMPDLHDNHLVLFMADVEALLSVPLPFAEPIATLTDRDPMREAQESALAPPSVGSGRTGKAREGCANAAHSSPNGGRSLREAAEKDTSYGYSQYLWGATSKAVSAASQGWSSSVQRWVPSASSSYFSGNFSNDHRSGAGSEAVLPAATTPPPQSRDKEPPRHEPSASSAIEVSAALSSQSSSVTTTTTTALPVTSTTTAAGVAASAHSFSIARPLMAAVFHFTGADKEPPMPPARPVPPPATSVPDGSDDSDVVGMSGVPTMSSGPQASPAGPLPSATSPPYQTLPPFNDRSLSSADARSSSEASTTLTAATSLAVRIHVAHGERDRSGSCARSNGSRRGSHHSHHSQYSHHHHRRSMLSSASLCDEEVDRESSTVRHHRRRGTQRLKSEASTLCGAPASPTPHTISVEEGAAQASYVAQQMTLLSQESHPTPSETAVSAEKSVGSQTGSKRGAPTQEEIHFALRHLVDVEEPLQRNMVLYGWKDGHNDLYIRLSVEQDALVQPAASAAASSRTTRDLASPRNHPGTLFSTLTNTSTDAADGVHSVGFLSSYNSAMAWRAETESYGDCFNFEDYFASLQVPQHLLDVQERDKCRLELADLRLQQERDLAAVRPFERMTVYQNEERALGEAGWRPHSTFPYDEEADGRVVDLNWLNRTAGSAAGTAEPVWRWATEKETRMWAEEQSDANLQTAAASTTTGRRVRSLVKELKDWTVGEWEYAERWPSRNDKLAGGSAGEFVWSSAETPSHRCRRRRLTRLRVNIEELRRQKDLTESHIRELCALREELGL